MTNSQPRNTAATTAIAPQTAAGFPPLAEDAALQLAHAIAEAAAERKGANIMILQVGDVSYLADYFVVVTGFSTVQVRAITRSIEGALEADWNRRPLRVEGQTEGNWVLMDYGEVIVHIFMPEAREFYDLEAFWGHANQMLYQPIERA
ncbi:MAG: ribosome silencing factor [Leptolyngbyaceae cyanobacterium SM2_5_2]|nr:ribosome silencing factor [Leptolyngbyaceae cyanobacterium SM2_5_2]